jgi:hypothetical protein
VERADNASAGRSASDSWAGCTVAVGGTVSEHLAARPAWDCVACGRPWPCDTARERLAAELNSIQLVLYLWGNLEEATGDLPGMSVDEMTDRFLRWARPAQSVCPPSSTTSALRPGVLDRVPYSDAV